MKKIAKLTFLGGIVLLILSFLSLLLGRGVWVPATGVAIMYMGVATAIIGFTAFRSVHIPEGHKFAWAAIGGGMFSYSIGTLFRLKLAGPTGISASVFVTTDYLLVFGYALLTGGYYIFLSRAGNIIDEIEKLKIIWGVGIFAILVVDLIIAMEATAIFGKTTAGMLVNIYYISLDILMLLIGISYLFAYKDGKISFFYRVLFISIVLWLIVDAVFVFRGSYGKPTSFVIAWGKVIPVFLLLYAQKIYIEIFAE